MAKIKPVNMDSDTFAVMKQDMSNAINRLLRHMQRYNAEKASLNVKLTVSLSQEELDNGEKGTIPLFEHKVTSTVQIKDESAGKLGGEYVLVDDGKGGHELRPITDQLDMFEEEDA